MSLFYSPSLPKKEHNIHWDYMTLICLTHCEMTPSIQPGDTLSFHYMLTLAKTIIVPAKKG